MFYVPSALQYRISESSSVTDRTNSPILLPPIRWTLPPPHSTFMPTKTTRRDPIFSNSYLSSFPALTIHQAHVAMPSTRQVKSSYRKSPHSAIEKRRRERINDKIDQLKYLIPICCPSSTTLPPASMHQPLHKLSVLQAAIEYIHQLHTQLLQHSPVITLQQQPHDLTLASTIAHAHRVQSHDHHPIP